MGTGPIGASGVNAKKINHGNAHAPAQILTQLTAEIYVKERLMIQNFV
jgi:hypothetical protein